MNYKFKFLSIIFIFNVFSGFAEKETETPTKKCINFSLTPADKASYEKLQPQHTVFSPWREEYRHKSKKIKKSCPFCLLFKEKNDTKNLILKRFKYYVVLMNKFPCFKGQLLVVPYEHKNEIFEGSPESQLELFAILRDSKKILSDFFNTKSFNVGINFGSYAGASIPDHCHFHIVPRDPGEERLGFMQTVAGVNQIMYDLNKLYEKLKIKFDNFDFKIT